MIFTKQKTVQKNTSITKDNTDLLINRDKKDIFGPMFS